MKMNFARPVCKDSSVAILAVVFLAVIVDIANVEEIRSTRAPAIGFSTYHGGNGEDRTEAMAVDRFGNIYIAGWTKSKGFPTVNAIQRRKRGSTDGFVAKINPKVPEIVYSTYIGGQDVDEVLAIAVDEQGNAYVTGWTASTDFPVLNAYQPDFRGVDAFVTKLDPNGQLVFSTYFGGNGSENGTGIAFHRNKIYVSGITNSDDFPVALPSQPNILGPGEDAFLSTFTSDGSRLLFSTFIGGSDSDHAHDVAVDPRGNIYVTGTTMSVDFPVVKPLQPKINGSRDAFVMKFAANRSVKYSTYLGGSFVEDMVSVAADRYGRAHITGSTNSTDFPLFRPFQRIPGDSLNHAFISKIKSDGSGFIFSTYLSGSGAEYPYDIAATAEKTLVTGWTNSSDFPLRNSLQAFNLGEDIFGPDAFVIKLNKTGSIVYSTYLGGSFGEDGGGIAVGSSNTVCITGSTDSLDFPLRNAIQKEHSKDKLQNDLFVTCLD